MHGQLSCAYACMCQCSLCSHAASAADPIYTHCLGIGSGYTRLYFDGHIVQVPKITQCHMKCSDLLLVHHAYARHVIINLI